MSEKKYWLWPILYVIYFAGCIKVGWENPAISAMVVVLALLAFLGVKRLPETVFAFARVRNERPNGFQVYHMILKAVNDSTELMAICLLLPLLFVAAQQGGELGGIIHLPHFHVPWAPVLTIIGIMTAANNAMNEIISQLDVIERKIGKFWTLVFVSLLSSLTGEPANAAIQNRYLIPRLPADEKLRARVGVGIAASIGSGGGLTFFSPPAVIIIWGTMTSVFGWGIGMLLAAIGSIAIAHVVATVLMYYKHIGEAKHVENVDGDYTKSQSSLWILAAVITGHIFIALPIGQDLFWVVKAVYAVDIILGFFCFGQALLGQIGQPFSLHSFEHQSQPILIGGLLIAIDNIGILAEPAIIWLGVNLPFGGISMEYLPIILAMVLYLITGVTSALADNALATKVYILLPITIAKGLLVQGVDPVQASYVANAGAVGVIVGALTWGWITVQGNLPNFPIKSAFKIDPIHWIRVGLPVYGWTLIIPAIGIYLVVQFVLPDMITPLHIPDEAALQVVDSGHGFLQAH